MQWIEQNDLKTVQETYQKWPHLRCPDVFKLINQDYQMMFSNQKGTIND